MFRSTQIWPQSTTAITDIIIRTPGDHTHSDAHSQVVICVLWRSQRRLAVVGPSNRPAAIKLPRDCHSGLPALHTSIEPRLAPILARTRRVDLRLWDGVGVKVSSVWPCPRSDIPRLTKGKAAHVRRSKVPIAGWNMTRVAGLHATYSMLVGCLDGRRVSLSDRRQGPLVARNGGRGDAAHGPNRPFEFCPGCRRDLTSHDGQ